MMRTRTRLTPPRRASVAATILWCFWSSSAGLTAAATIFWCFGSPLTGLTALANDMVRPTSLSGHWVAEVVMPDSAQVTLHVDLDSRGARWIGEFDVNEFGIENYPVEVAFAGSSVKLHFAGPDADFEGDLEDDGKILIGAIQLGDASIRTELRRTGEAQFSATFLELQAVADDSTLVQPLSGTGVQLRQRFNDDVGKVRLLMLLSPT